MADPRANTDAEKKKMDMDRNCKRTPGKNANKKGDGIPDSVKGSVAAGVKRPEMNDPTTERTESDDEDLEPVDDWKPPTKEDEEKARREK